MNSSKENEALQKTSNNSHLTNDKVRLKEDALPEKVFAVRNSLLIDLFENTHIQTVYHLFIATLIGLFANTVAHDYIKRGEIKLGLRLIIIGFGRLHIAIISWFVFFLMTCFCYYCFKIWAKIRFHLPPKSANLRMWDAIWFIIVPSYYAFSFKLASVLVTIFELPPASAAIVVFDQTRLLMKVHAFVRSNAPKVLKHKIHDEESLELPSFLYYLYFLFIPTLVYRDEYPRTEHIRWRFVFFRALEIVAVIFYYSFVFERLLIPHYQEFGKRKFSWSEVILLNFEAAVPGLLLTLSTFFMVLHSVQNMFAELLRFGDRLFYKDWWTSSSFSYYYRTWNVIVHDWLYTYVYKDMYEIVIPKKKTIAKFTVFMLSAIVHEWLVTYMFGLFFPVLFIEFFFIGQALGFMNAPRHVVLNVLFLYGLAFGAGSIVSLYTLEYYARKNVPVENPRFIDFFIPRLLNCDCIE